MGSPQRCCKQPCSSMIDSLNALNNCIVSLIRLPEVENYSSSFKFGPETRVSKVSSARRGNLADSPKWTIMIMRQGERENTSHTIHIQTQDLCLGSMKRGKARIQSRTAQAILATSRTFQVGLRAQYELALQGHYNMIATVTVSSPNFAMARSHMHVNKRGDFPSSA